ncbi:PREDICTED: carboxypeptidase A2-like isoform X2 [Papilio xuthus]|uniref:Carboxypeptidase A2-like isoform X2 n=1 Tax=Papilio xuthus TaxID=66420 RepID=A0AAJ6ZZC9_PAPXU|nr:PREDICTED: carboxypeptidase A2-like isoform X2 [Papilio xuthus]
MARRLALLALLPLALTYAVALRSPALSRPTHHAYSDYDSLDPLDWDDYNTYETSPVPRSDKPSAKVILRGHVPKINVSTKNSKRDDKNKVIKTSIKIESYTNIIVTKSPQVINRIKVTAGTKVPHKPTRVPVPNGWEAELYQKPSSTTKRPTARRSTTPRRAATTVQPTKATRRPVVPTVPTRRPTASRRPANKPRTTTKKPKPLKNKKPCPQKNVGWLSSFFQENDLKKSPKKEVKTGIFSSIYKWLWGRSSWFGGVWLDDTQSKQSSTTSTTPVPLTTSTNNWFQAMLHSEENDDTLPSQSVKKPAKKSLKKNYKGFQLIRAYPDAQWKVQEMLDLQEEGQGSGLMWWTSPSLNGSTDLLVPPDLLEDVRAHLKSNKIEYDVIIYDLQKAIAYENPKLSKKQRIELEHLRGHPMTWRRYHRYADILRYLEYLQLSHTDIVELVPLGRSSEGLPLVAVKVSLPSNETQAKELGGRSEKRWRLKSFMKPAVWLDGGAHAREWIAPAVATWMLHALVEGEKGLGPDYELLKMADFYILPVLNPDGYEHSHTHDRLWMKTRSRFQDRSDDYYVGWFPWNWGSTECVGVDTDRNWDYRWGEMDSSRDPCEDNYAGPHPFSEPETRAVSEFLAEHRGQIKVYLSFHAYTQTWLTPSTEALTSYGDDGIMMEMGKLATAALADMYGSKYQVGTAAEFRKPASGMAHDWAKARAGIKFSYHVDLRDSIGRHGFLLPGSQIVPTARETWQAVKAIVDNLTPG